MGSTCAITNKTNNSQGLYASEGFFQVFAKEEEKNWNVGQVADLEGPDGVAFSQLQYATPKTLEGFIGGVLAKQRFTLYIGNPTSPMNLNQRDFTFQQQRFLSVGSHYNSRKCFVIGRNTLCNKAHARRVSQGMGTRGPFYGIFLHR